MANEEHVARLKQGVEVWNIWRREDRWAFPDLEHADLHSLDLHGAATGRSHIFLTECANKSANG